MIKEELFSLRQHEIRFADRRQIESSPVQTINAKVLSILKLRSYRKKGQSDDQNKDATIGSWRMRVSYLGPDMLYAVELREPLKDFALKKPTVGLNGFVEFEMFSDPHVSAGESIQIDAYESGEKILGGGGL
jgi:hypothetical protein